MRFGVGHEPVEVGDQVSGSVRHGGFRPLDAERAVFDAAAGDRTGPRRGDQPAQALVQGEPAALGEPVARTGRDRQAAAVGISDGGSRQQRLSDVAVAARPRQPDVAGADFEFGPQEAGRPRRAVAAQDADRFQQGLDVQRAAP